MPRAERNDLLEKSVPVDSTDPRSRRFALRRSPTAGLEIFDCKCHEIVDGVSYYHGHPASYVPTTVLRVWRDEGIIVPAEYKALRKNFGCI